MRYDKSYSNELAYVSDEKSSLPFLSTLPYINYESGCTILPLYSRLSSDSAYARIQRSEMDHATKWKHEHYERIIREGRAWAYERCFGNYKSAKQKFLLKSEVGDYLNQPAALTDDEELEAHCHNVLLRIYCETKDPAIPNVREQLQANPRSDVKSSMTLRSEEYEILRQQAIEKGGILHQQAIEEGRIIRQKSIEEGETLDQKWLEEGYVAKHAERIVCQKVPGLKHCVISKYLGIDPTEVTQAQLEDNALACQALLGSCDMHAETE